VRIPPTAQESGKETTGIRDAAREPSVLKDKVLRNILFLSLATVLVLSAYNIFFIFPSFTNQFIEVSENDAVRIATHLSNALGSGHVPLTKDSLPDAFRKEAELLGKDFRLMKVMLFSPSGETVYSSDPSNMEHGVDEAFFFDVVAKGKVYREFVRKNTPSASGQVVTADVIEAYVPIMSDGKFLGACEVYMDITGRRMRNDSLLRRSFLALFVLGFGLLAAVLIALLKANKSIRARRRVEEALRKSEHFLEAIIETEPECVKLLAPDGGVLRMNRAGLAMIEADSFDQIKGQPVSALVTEDYRRAFDTLTREVFQGKSGSLEFEIVGIKGRHLWLETHAVPLRNEKDEIIALLGITRDITAQRQAVEDLQNEINERKRAEQEIRKLNLELRRRAAQLEQSYKDLESFSFAASHDLREPLIVIEWFCGNLLKKYADRLDDEGMETLGVIKDKARQMGQLINDLLFFSRISTEEVMKSDIDMEALAKSVFSGMKAGINDRDVRLEVKEMPVAWGDPSMVRQVLTNLLSNALKYTRAKAIAHIEIGGSEEETENTYYVKDNGIGFRSDDSDRLFGLFQRLQSSQEFEGTGAGLVIVKRIIEKHGGSVRAEGKVDEGATFFFSLPSKKHP
jgi:PAS domain S-box-containing protein